MRDYMNKKTMVVVIGLVLSLSIINISTMILPVRAAVSISASEKVISINPIIFDNGGSMAISEPKTSINSKPFNNNDDPIYDLIIIAPQKFVGALQPLVDHKNSLNPPVKTILVKTSEIYDGDYFPVQGRDKPEKIKYFIKNAYDEWGIKYVLLVGIDIPGFRDLPVRYCYNSDIGTGFDEPCFISDLYYADIYDTTSGEFSSWDTDNDGIFGEWYMNEPAEDNNIDLYPDVYVGRLPCKFTSQVEVTVDKIIKYETTAYGENWFKNIIGISGDTYPDGHWKFPTPGYEGEMNVGSVLENMSNIGFNPTSLFVSDGSFSGPRDIRREINKGAGFVFLDGHSGPGSWACKDENAVWYQGISIFDGSAYLFSNKEKLPVYIWGGCHTFQFDVGAWKIFTDPDYKNHMTWVWECLAWSAVRLPRGGAIAAIGCTGLGLTKEDRDDCWTENGTIPTEGNSDYLEAQFFSRYINDGGSSSGSDILLGEIMGNAISDYLDHFPINWNDCATNDSSDDAKTLQEWVLFGDPSLKIGGYENDGGDSDLEVVVANTESSVNGYVGASVQFQASASGGTGSYVYDWQFEGGQLNYNTGKTAGCTWYSPGVYQATVKVTDTNGKECTYNTFVSIGIKPNAPSGPISGKIGAEYTFTARITCSPSQDRICYIFDWGDETCSNPIGPYTTKDQIVVEARHVWRNPGTYQIRVKTWLIDSGRDLFEETGWSDPLRIDITGKVFDRTVSQSILQRLPYR